MKTPATSQRERAVALIIVLAMLLLLSGLIVSFMTSVGNERAASVASNNEITTRQLADSTVNLVIGQIRQATTQAEAASVATTWASQPGAIRTFSGTVGPPKFVNTGAAGVIQFTYKPGSNDYIFKLYSAENMKIPASQIDSTGCSKRKPTSSKSGTGLHPKVSARKTG
jgi:Tfp pilus assembly protein PilX